MCVILHFPHCLICHLSSSSSRLLFFRLFLFSTLVCSSLNYSLGSVVPVYVLLWLPNVFSLRLRFPFPSPSFHFTGFQDTFLCLCLFPFSGSYATIPPLDTSSSFSRHHTSPRTAHTSNHLHHLKLQPQLLSTVHHPSHSLASSDHRMDMTIPSTLAVSTPHIRLVQS